MTTDFAAHPEKGTGSTDLRAIIGSKGLADQELEQQVKFLLHNLALSIFWKDCSKGLFKAT